MVVALDQVTAWSARAHGAVTDRDAPALNGPHVAFRLQHRDGSTDGIAVRAVLRCEVVQSGQSGTRRPLPCLDPFTDLGGNVLVARLDGHVDTLLPEIIPRQSLTGTRDCPQTILTDCPKTILPVEGSAGVTR